MSEHYPRVRLYSVYDTGRYLSIREGVNITFYMRRTHREVAPAVMRALEVYHRAVGPQALGLYADYEGESQKLDDKGWEFVRSELLENVGTNLNLFGDSSDATCYEFFYCGQQFDHPLFPAKPGDVCAAAFWLPTEYLEEHGPGRVRELALELAAVLPFNTGHAGLAFLFPENLLGMHSAIRDLCFRYPGLDIPDLDMATGQIGTRVKGAHWLTFLGQPVLGELGGTAGLRARLHSPHTTVQELEGDRAVVTLGKWPEAGDLEQGRTLPEYRELARILEPWLWRSTNSWSGFTEEDIQRWQRRFLD
ncbi:DUF3396 domain-containing protein [Archangium lansingense]|uniref:DUF3396 domain-containing protein n=1 Tax=Archangium lansingense TaxID=2995310 RepID=A0ABT4AGJ7_9BACT|nr:DUF3396 domain-containing protein [Archangium lansinium]MCY1080807.1 DUF3396 domain-containing protein [Archangium lansinium]